LNLGLGGWIDHLSDELVFIDVQSGLLFALEAVRAHLRHSDVIECLGSKRFLNPLSSFNNAGARFACMDRRPDGAAANVDSLFPSGIGETQRVGWRADENRCFTMKDGLQTLLRRLPSPGNTHEPHSLSRFECSPKSNERPERKRDVHAIAPPHACAFEN